MKAMFYHVKAVLNNTQRPLHKVKALLNKVKVPLHKLKLRLNKLNLFAYPPYLPQVATAPSQANPEPPTNASFRRSC